MRRLHEPTNETEAFERSPRARTSPTRDDRAGINRRDMLKGVAAALPAMLFPSGFEAAESSGDVRLRDKLDGLSEEASEWAEGERDWIECENSEDGFRMPYISVFEWDKAVFACSGVGRLNEVRTMFDAAKSRVAGSNCKLLAEGWSEDRQVWTLFIQVGAAEASQRRLPGSVALMMRSVAPKVDVWRWLIWLDPDDKEQLIVKAALVGET